MARLGLFSSDQPHEGTCSGPHRSFAAGLVPSRSGCQGIHAHGLKPQKLSHRPKGQQKAQAPPAQRQRPRRFPPRYPDLEPVKDNRRSFLAGNAVALCPAWKGEAIARVAHTAPGGLRHLRA